MSTREEPVDISVDGQRIAGTFLAPAAVLPGLLFVHGWGGSQVQYRTRAEEAAALGCLSLTFDLRGHARHEDLRATVTRADNLRDLTAAYDCLVGQRSVDRGAIGIVGSSYGGYLAAILTTIRPIRWLALRAPALYKDDGWDLPKRTLNEDPDLRAYRRRAIPWQENRALRACAEFEGDVLIVESEHDDVVPHPVSMNYAAACQRARSLTTRVIAGADHGLSTEEWQRAYTALLLNWLTEMVINARNAAPPTTSTRPGSASRGRQRGAEEPEPPPR